MHPTVVSFWKVGTFWFLDSRAFIWYATCILLWHITLMGVPWGGGGRVDWFPQNENEKPPGTITNDVNMQNINFLNSKSKKYIPSSVINFWKDFVSLCTPQWYGCLQGGGLEWSPPMKLRTWKYNKNYVYMQNISFLNSKQRNKFQSLIFPTILSHCTPQWSDFEKFASRAFIWYATCLLLIWHFEGGGCPQGGWECPPP